MSLVRWALNNPYSVTVAALIFMVAGAVALLQIPVDILPGFKSPGVLVMTFYSGMPANAIERNITNPMERWTSQATGVVRVESKSIVGASMIRLYLLHHRHPRDSAPA